jgi:hypothetical protein
MDPVIDCEELVATLTSAFKYRYDDASEKRVRMVGLVFARPNSPLAKSEIIPQLADWHHRSGNHIDFFFAGYTYPHELLPGFITVPVPGRGEWLYSSQLFDKFRREIEGQTRWKYSGESDLLLTNTFFDKASDQATLDFASTIVCQLDQMKEDKAILSVGRFFESVFRFAESANDLDPCWGFSDSQGLAVAGSALKRVALSLLPKNLDADFKKAEHFAIRDVARQ